MAISEPLEAVLGELLVEVLRTGMQRHADSMPHPQHVQPNVVAAVAIRRFTKARLLITTDNAETHPKYRRLSGQFSQLLRCEDVYACSSNLDEAVLLKLA